MEKQEREREREREGLLFVALGCNNVRQTSVIKLFCRCNNSWQSLAARFCNNYGNAAAIRARAFFKKRAIQRLNALSAHSRTARWFHNFFWNCTKRSACMVKNSAWNEVHSADFPSRDRRTARYIKRFFEISFSFQHAFAVRLGDIDLWWNLVCA